MNQSMVPPIAASWADFFWKNNFDVIPLYGISEDLTCKCGKSNCNSPGKHPIYKSSHEKFFQTSEAIRQFWQSNPSANYAIKTTQLVLIDVDAKNGGIESFDQYIKPYLEQIKTLVIQTGSGAQSKHIYFLDLNKEFKNATNIFPGIDIRATGGIAVGPGSRHYSGNVYSVVSFGDDTNLKIKISEIPPELKKILLATKQKKLNLSKDEIKAKSVFGGPVAQGSRNSTLTSIAGGLRRKGLTRDEMKPILIEKNKEFQPPMDESEVINILNSISSYEVGNSIDWAEPNLNYEVTNPGCADIPNDILPEPYRNFILKKAKALGVPKVAIAITLFTITSSLLGSAFRIKPNEKSQYSETLNLWGILIAPPSSRKTSILNIAKQVLERINRFFADQRKTAENEKNVEIAKLKAELKLAKKDAAQFATISYKLSNLLKYRIPSWTFTTNDVTTEALALLFQSNYRGILLLRDELNGILSNFSKNGYESFRSFLCEAWVGGNSHQINRVERGLIDIESATLSILGSIQPDIINTIFREELVKGMGSDGLFARFQLCAIYQTSDLSAPDVNINLNNEAAVVDGILSAIHEMTKDFNLMGQNPSQLLCLSSDAEKTFSKYQTKISKILANDEILNQAYKSHVGKFGRLVLSLSAQFHLTDAIFNQTEWRKPINVKWVELAIKWAEQMDYQAQKIYFSIGTNNSTNTLLARIRSGDIQDNMSIRSIYRKQWSGLRTRDEVLSAIETISESNWVRVSVESPVGGGHKTELLKIHPTVISWVNSRK